MTRLSTWVQVWVSGDLPSCSNYEQYPDKNQKPGLILGFTMPMNNLLAGYQFTTNQQPTETRMGTFCTHLGWFFSLSFFIQLFSSSSFSSFKCLNPFRYVVFSFCLQLKTLNHKLSISLSALTLVSSNGFLLFVRTHSFKGLLLQKQLVIVSHDFVISLQCYYECQFNL